MRIITLKDGKKIKISSNIIIDVDDDWVTIKKRPDLDVEMLIPIANIQYIETKN